MLLSQIRKNTLSIQNGVDPGIITFAILKFHLGICKEAMVTLCKILRVNNITYLYIIISNHEMGTLGAECKIHTLEQGTERWDFHENPKIEKIYGNFKNFKANRHSKN